MSPSKCYVCSVDESARQQILDSKAIMKKEGEIHLLHQNPAALLRRLLDVIRNDILPLTEEEMKRGGRVFGAAILRKSDLQVVVAGTNKFTSNPLYHGEVACLQNFYALPEDERPLTKDCIFLASHEPCSLCLSAITWSGFDNFYFLFSYEDTARRFSMPHDLIMLEEIFGVKDGKYNRQNLYWSAFSLRHLNRSVEDPQHKELEDRMDEITGIYSALWNSQQNEEDVTTVMKTKNEDRNLRSAGIH